MWFDANARLAELEEELAAKPAKPAKLAAPAPTEFSSLARSELPNLDFPRGNGPVAGTPRHKPARPRSAPTCAHCGLSDWTVSLTDICGARLHVACWQERQEHD